MPVTLNSVVQVLIFLAIVLLITKPMGLYLTAIFSGRRTWLTPVFRPVERLVYRLCGINPEEEQKWWEYVIAMLVFNMAGMLLLYLLERTQQWHGPLFNPQNLPNVEARLAFNTAASFTTNTNWQNYAGEQTMTYLTQMAGLAYHNFVSAATGIALAVALVRGLARRSAQQLGNFWVDLTRCTLYLLLPICIVGALVLVSQGVIQNFNPYTVVHTLNGQTQVIAQGPVASQEIIKELGTNGGGFFREPQRVHQFNRDAGNHLYRSGPVLYVRQDGGRHATGLGAMGCLGHHLRCRNGRSAASRAKRKSTPDQHRSESNGERYAAGRQHGGQGRAFWHYRLDAVGR